MNTLVPLFSVVLIGVLQWLMPALVSPTLPFGVRVPRDHADAPVITAQRRRYRVVTAAVTVVAAAAVPLGSGHPWAAQIPLGGEVLAGALVYLLVRRRIIAVKSAENWFGGRRQVTMADTSLRTDPERYPWPWSVPAVLLTVSTVVAAVVEYPRMPARIPMHFGASGRPDRYAAKSVAAAFGPVLAQVAATLLLLGLAAAVLHARARLDVEDVGAAARHRRFVAAIARALLVLAACTSVTFLVSSLSAWDVIRPAGAALAVLGVLPLLAGVAVLLVVVVRTRPGGGLPVGGLPVASPPAGGAAVVNRDDDRNYLWGLFYFDRDDPSLFVPKRFGIGWTLNLARPGTWLIFGLVVAMGVIPPLLH